MRRLLVLMITTTLAVVVPGLPTVDAQLEGDDTLFEAAVVIETLSQPPQVRNDNGGECIILVIPGYDVHDADGNFEYRVSDYVDPCHWEVFCQSYRVDDIQTDPVFAEFTSSSPIPIFDVFENHVIVLTFCRESGIFLDRSITEPALLPYSSPSWAWVPIVDEVDDIPGTLLDLWSSIPEPSIDINGAPPVQENTWVQASTWWWIGAIETPLLAISVNPADTAALMVQAKVERIEWDFGDGTEPLVCEADRLIVWDDSLDPYDDADQGCTHIYEQVSNDGFDVIANVTFAGEQSLIARTSAAASWPEPDWQPYAQTREVPGSLLVPVYEIAARN